ncbi:MAG: hypothetical protein PF443_07845 [Allgaiera sp.]|jgi:hypothetical protein|nr:hypothetical protein [Allgaiera sp.]
MKRFTDWQSRLISYLHDVLRRPFQEGMHDCALFAAGAVEAMTGEDYAAPYRGRYTTTLGGLRILRKDGYDDHVALAAAHLAEVPGAFAQPGDLAVIPTDDGPSLGVVQGDRVYCLLPIGLGLEPLSSATRAFRV